MFKAALFIIAKTWKQPSFPPVGKGYTDSGVPILRNTTQPSKGMNY